MSHIVLIGPIGVGKSTVAPRVAELLGRQVVDLDELRGELYATLDYDNAVADAVYERDGVAGLLGYWKPFELALVEHAVRLPDAVLDFGAGHSHFEDEGQFARVAAALAPHHVVLLLPSDDIDRSERILAARQPEEYRDVSAELNAMFLRSRSNAALADRVVITGERTPDEVAADVVRDLTP